MASDESSFVTNMLASSHHGDIMVEHDPTLPGSVQASGAQFLGNPLDVSSLVTDIAPQPQIRSNNKPATFKGSWTAEEDSILRDMVIRLGEGRWALIAQSLPGRIGKQCRERWINHVDPNNKKKHDIWTVEDDMVLIQAHKSYGRHWTTIARFLPGRPENDIKNHWNSTKRSLDSKKHRLKKKKSEQVAPGQLSILEEYILSLEPGSKSAGAQPPASPPVINPRAGHTSAPLEMEMHLNAPKLPAPVPHQPRTLNLGNSLLPDLNISCDPQEMHYTGYPMYAHVSALQLVNEEPKQATFNWFPFVEQPFKATLNNAGESSSNVGATSYYNEEAGPSNICGSGNPAGDNNDDFLELASREFVMPSSEEVSLGLARFK